MGAILSCFSDPAEEKRRRPVPRRRPPPASGDAVAIGSSNRWRSGRRERGEESRIHEQALAAAAALIIQQSGGAPPFDRSASLRYPSGGGGKKQGLPRSSSTRARSLTDPVVQPQELVNQDAGGFVVAKEEVRVRITGFPNGVFVLMILIPSVATERASLKFLFTHFNTENGARIHSKVYIFVLGLLMSQYSMAGYDTSAHLAEPRRRPLVNFIAKVQKDVTPHMRAILVDWLVDVAEEYKLVSDTFYLTISYIDRFLSMNAVDKKKLQLLGVSSMLIASKYEEISPPNVEDFCYITDNTYTKHEVVKMESDILEFLNFEMGNPTIKTFLRRFIKAGQEDDRYPTLQLEFLANYLSELSLLEYSFVRFLPSIVAASAVFIARFAINPNIHPWSSSLQNQTGYRLSELKDCIHAVHELHITNKCSTLTATRDKYKQHRFKCVSTLHPPLEIPASYFEGF